MQTLHFTGQSSVSGATAGREAKWNSHTEHVWQGVDGGTRWRPAGNMAKPAAIARLCRLGRRSWGTDLGEAGPQGREGAQNVGRTICDRSRKFGVEQPSGRGRNGRITAGCHRLFLVTRWGSFAKETGRSQCTSEYYYSTRKCTVTKGKEMAGGFIAPTPARARPPSAAPSRQPPPAPRAPARWARG